MNWAEFDVPLTFKSVIAAIALFGAAVESPVPAVTKFLPHATASPGVDVELHIQLLFQTKFMSMLDEKPMVPKDFPNPALYVMI